MEKWIVKHSESKNAFNIVGTDLGGKYKIARVTYQKEPNLKSLNNRWRKEAESHAKLICLAPELLETIIILKDHLKDLIEEYSCESAKKTKAIRDCNLLIKKATE